MTIVNNIFCIIKPIRKVFHLALLMQAMLCFSHKPLALAKADKQLLLQEYSAEISKVENYLNNITNLSSNFTQISSSGTASSGKFYLSRPGKMRIEYDTDPAIVIVVNGPVLSYYDIELEEISNLRTNTTPASLLTRKNISFLAKDIEIIDIEKNQNYIKLTIAKKNNKDSGNFSLLFNLDPIEFLQMEVKNDLDDLIKVVLQDVDLQSIIDNDLFILKTK